MISQPKIIFNKKKHLKRPHPARLFFTLIIFALTSLLTANIFPQGIILAETPHANATVSGEFLLPSQLLSITPTPKQQPYFPVLGSLTATVATQPATATSSAKIAEVDYCLDVPVLMYHHVQPLSVAELLGHAQLTVDSEIFDDQMKYLKDQGYTALSANELVNALIKEQKLPKKPILITIDDGYDDNYTYAFVSAKKHQMVMNFMIPSALIDKPGYMTWDHLREMKNNLYARIYNHTATHAALGNISTDAMKQELASSTAAFKEQLGLSVDIFTYPYGSYNDMAVEVLKEQGFKAAFTTDDGRHQCKSSLMKLQRYHVGNVPLSYYGF